VLGPDQGVHKVVHDRTQSVVLVAGYLEFDEPRVITKGGITEPVDKVIRAAFLGNKGYGDARLRNARLIQSTRGVKKNDAYSHRPRLTVLLFY
jgi:hypothetical protein